MARKRYLIIGDGAAGLTAAQKLRRNDPTAMIAVLSDEPYPAYFRAALTNYLLGELREDQLWAVAPDFYDVFSIHRVFTRVTAVDTAKSQVWCSTSATPLGYDQLLVASGARPRTPAFPGAQLPGVLTLRTIQDARTVVDHVRLRGLKTAVVLGGGALGLEWAHALREHSVRVTILERAARFMPNVLDQVASDLLATRLRQAGIEVILGDEVEAVYPGPQGTVGSLRTKQGRTLPCELVAAALGVVPNSEFLANTGITLTANGGVSVDRRMQTSVRNVWAAGDVANVEGEQLALWEPARFQARTAAENMCGRSATYAPGAHYFATRLFDLDFARVGSIQLDASGEELVDMPRGTGTIAYRKIVLSNGRVRGALMIGERSAKVRTIGRAMKRLVDAQADVQEVRDDLLNPSFDVGAFLGPRKLLEKPPEPKQTAHIVPAKVRGTQVLNLTGVSALASTPVGDGTLKSPTRAPGLSDPAAAAAVLSGGTAAIPSTRPRATKVLSIGLQAEAPPEKPSYEPALNAQLEFQGRVFPITALITNIGQAPNSDIVVNDPQVGSTHAQIAQHEGMLYLRDLGSRTGTLVNGELLTAFHKLSDGDRIRIGSSELVLRAPALSKRDVGAAQLVRTPRLEVRSGPGLGISFALGEQPALIGSDASCSIRLADLSVLPKHARVRAYGAAHYICDLGSSTGTWVRGAAIPQGQEVQLQEGDFVRVGSVDLFFSTAPVRDAFAALRPRAKVSINSGADTGRMVTFEEKFVAGSDPSCNLPIAGAAPRQLEIVQHNGAFWARELTFGGVFRAGAPLGPNFVQLQHGDMLLLPSGVMLHFEEA